MSDASPRQAEQAATADDLLDGSVRDAHGEVSQDPERCGASELHRRQAAAVETTNRRAADETLGTTRADHPGSLQPD